MSDTAGKINAYTCEKCARKIITINLDDGVTPFMTGCPYCGSPAQSAFYRVPQTMSASHEWYLPGAEEIAAMKKYPELLQTVEHIGRGGLMLRKITEPRVTWLESWLKRNKPGNKPDPKPYESRQMNEDPGPRLVVGGCHHCNRYHIILWENAMYEGSCTPLFGDHDSMEEALSEACFWGNIMGVPVEVEDGHLGELVDGDIVVRGRDGEIIAGPREVEAAGQEPGGPELTGGPGGSDRAPVEPRSGPGAEVPPEAQDSVHADPGRDGEQGEPEADQPGA